MSVRNDDPDFGNIAELRAKMLVWARRMTGDGPNAEDLVQTALMRLIMNRHRMANVPVLDAWAYTILRTEAGMARRRERGKGAVPRTYVGLEDVLLVAPDNPETAVYCRQVCAMALGLNAEMLLSEPDVPENATQRTQRRRARIELTRAAA